MKTKSELLLSRIWVYYYINIDTERLRVTNERHYNKLSANGGLFVIAQVSPQRLWVEDVKSDDKYNALIDNY